MPRRLHQTLADYVVIAISPAIIMLLVGSLVFFLLRVFYQGTFPERLHWVMACFVFAAVLIARISIEDGYERAMLFAIPLGLAVGVASNRFMEFEGTWIDTLSWPINFAIIGIIWFCAHKLTWDCTVIDDAEDASGEGLLQVAGLERPTDQRNATGRGADNVDRQRRLEGTTAREVPATIWQRYVEHQRRPHAPGVWVVYFSLAALPLFGIGQWFIPESNTGARRYVFWLLCVYVASGLSLLVTTSFLGLRRYLRQRRIEMPTLMANVWLAIGAAIIVALLATAALLPRPSAEYAIAELPFRVGSPRREASRQAPLKRDGTEDNQPAPAAAAQPPESPEDRPPRGAGNQAEGQAQGADAATKESAESKSGNSSSGNSEQGESQQQSSQGARSQPSEQGSELKQKIDEAIRRQRQDAQQRQQQEQQERQEQERSLQTQAEADHAPPPQESGQSRSDAPPSDEPPPSESLNVPMLSPAMQIVRWAMYAIFTLGVLWALWRYRAEVAAAARSFCQELVDFWNRLWGRKPELAIAGEQPRIEIPPTPFASFDDPFATGQAARYSAEELVRYSFEAFEAWSREHGCQREPEQTPHELARDVARLNAFITADARNIAELYARVAYAKGALPADARERVARLWTAMRSRAAAST